MSGRNQWEGPNLQAFFSDTTEEYVTPAEPDLYDQVTIRLRVGREEIQSCFLVTGAAHMRMRLEETDGLFDYYAVRFEVTVNPLRYYFEIAAGGRVYRYTRRGVRNTVHPADWWHIVPGFHTPSWAEGAVMYQIFVDRFFNGDPSNDVLDGEYRYEGHPVIRVRDWTKPPTLAGYREFYGGDLQGVIDKLDYLQELGIEAIYLNPVFLSPSSHKYDTQDYEHIDPHFGKIVRDLEPEAGRTSRGTGRKKASPADREDPEASEAGGSSGGTSDGQGHRRGSRSNRRNDRYLLRVTDPANLEASDRLFAGLVREAHRRGIRVILDGVFNHCGSFHRWLDKERIYEQLPGGVKGARASKRSPYSRHFRFSRDAWPANDSYDAWWEFGTLPKLNYEESEELCAYILRIGRKWVSPPYNADGWRLDVAADLGYSPAFNHSFWRRFRDAVKEANPEAVILAENYTRSEEWLQGGEWDTIMNYEFFMEPVTWFFTGMEKHSDAVNEDLCGDADAFWQAVRYWNLDRMPDAPLRLSMNELSNHDHSRFLTRTNGAVGRTQTLGPEAADRGVRMEIMRQAVLLQMTWPGAPTIYYGDEAGLGGFTDPDCRRTYPWGREDMDLLQYHRILIALRRENPALRRGSLLRLPDDDGLLAYARFCRGTGGGDSGASTPGFGMRGGPTTFIVLFNVNEIPVEYEADVTCAGIPHEAELECLLRTDREGYRRTDIRLPVRSGILHMILPPDTGFLLKWELRENTQTSGPFSHTRIT